MGYPAEPPPDQQHRSDLGPNLAPGERTMHMVLREPEKWHIVDIWKYDGRGSSSRSTIASFLRRRGFTVARRHFGDQWVAYARWPHTPVTEMAPFQEDAA